MGEYIILYPYHDSCHHPTIAVVRGTFDIDRALIRGLALCMRNQDSGNLESHFAASPGVDDGKELPFTGRVFDGQGSKIHASHPPKPHSLVICDLVIMRTDGRTRLPTKRYTISIEVPRLSNGHGLRMQWFQIPHCFIFLAMSSSITAR